MGVTDEWDFARLVLKMSFNSPWYPIRDGHASYPYYVLLTIVRLGDGRERYAASSLNTISWKEPIEW